MNKINKGFTLIELLAVIVILVLILVIAVPQINKLITNSKKDALSSDMKIILRQLEYDTLEGTSDITTIDETNIESRIGIKNDNYESITITKVDDKPYILIKGKNKWDGLIVYGTEEEIIIDKEDKYDDVLEEVLGTNPYNEEKGVNKPELAQGMVPIVWNGTTWIDTTKDDTNWYDYSTQKWANVRTQDGSMWVWIPRYVYKISSGFHSNTTGTIDVQFSMGTDDTRNNTVTLDTGTTSDASNNKWTNHPGFTFGSTELNGIWVAKFEASVSNQSDLCYTSPNSSNCDNTTLMIKIIPNVTSWKYINIGNAYTVARNMETNNAYGWVLASTLKSDGTYTTDTNNVDTHLIKNVEWGAVVYLSKSSYGKNATEVWINPANNYTTGCAGTSETSSGTTGCTNTYSTSNGVQASTTGNVYGIYDMSGGANELISAYVNNGNSYLTMNGSSIINANTKYKDIYTKGATDDQINNYALTVQKKGDALYETSNGGDGSWYSWFSDYSSMPLTSNPWFLRGGAYYNGISTGIFSFNRTTANPSDTTGFRPIILVSTGI